MSKRVQTLLEQNIFCPDLCGRGTVKPLWRERFKKNAVSVSEFTGFVWTEDRSVKKKTMQFNKYPNSCEHGLTVQSRLIST